MEKIFFKTKLLKIRLWILLCLPENASKKLPTRGMAVVRGIINGHPFRVVLEPDGRGSHWFRVNDILAESVGIAAGDTVTVEMEPTKEWLEPEMPSDLKDALIASTQTNEAWMDITPLARWDWIRWINSTGQPETRKKRIKNTCNMLKAGKRRPCCFNRSMCTETYVSKNGVLLDQPCNDRLELWKNKIVIGSAKRNKREIEN